MIVLRKTHERLLKEVNQAALDRVSEVTKAYGKALESVRAQHDLMSAWIRKDAENITPEQMADLFYAMDEEQQGQFFNVMQDRVTAYHDAQKANPRAFPSSPGYPAGEGQWYHAAKHLNDSGFETLEAMMYHAKNHRGIEQ